MGLKLLYFVLIQVICASSRAVYLELNSLSNDEAFMKRYGYLTSEQTDLDFAYTASSIAAAVQKVQAFPGLPQTGLLDDDNRLIFKKKRCSVKDIEDSSTRSRRHVLQQGWNKRLITYRVINGSSSLSVENVEALMDAALAVWAPHGRLQFERSTTPADIQVSFISGDHGDGHPFDGPGREVAHSFYPPNGAIHFDYDEIWDSDPDKKFGNVTNFFAVAVHEIGHALGLPHSSVEGSVMNPYYQVPVRLHFDDILAMQEIYLRDELSQWTSATSESPATAPVARFTKADSEKEDIPDEEDKYDPVQVLQGNILVFEEENPNRNTLVVT